MNKTFIEETLNKLGIRTRGNFTSDDSYVIDIDSFDELSYFDSLLDNNDDFHFDDEVSMLTNDTSIQVFSNEDLRITLLGNFESDTYKIVVKEV